MFFLELKIVINKNWAIFEKIFSDQRKFEMHLDNINDNRVDAHAKDINDDDLITLRLSLKWFEKALSI